MRCLTVRGALDVAVSNAFGFAVLVKAAIESIESHTIESYTNFHLTLTLRIPTSKRTSCNKSSLQFVLENFDSFLFATDIVQVSNQAVSAGVVSKNAASASKILLIFEFMRTAYCRVILTLSLYLPGRAV